MIARTLFTPKDLVAQPFNWSDATFPLYQFDDVSPRSLIDQRRGGAQRGEEMLHEQETAANLSKRDVLLTSFIVSDDRPLITLKSSCFLSF